MVCTFLICDDAIFSMKTWRWPWDITSTSLSLATAVWTSWTGESSCKCQQYWNNYAQSLICRTHFFLAPLSLLLIFFIITLAMGWNLSRWLADTFTNYNFNNWTWMRLAFRVITNSFALELILTFFFPRGLKYLSFTGVWWTSTSIGSSRNQLWSKWLICSYIYHWLY